MWTATGLENRGNRKVGGSTPQLSAILRMVGREVRHRDASAATPKGYRGSIPSPSAMDGWQSGNAARWKRAEPARVRTFDPCTVRHFRACSPIGRRRHLEGVNSAGSNPAARTSRASPTGRGSSFKTRSVPVRIRGAAPGFLSPQTAVDRPTTKQGRGVDQFESGGTHHHFRARRHSPTSLARGG